VCYWREGRSGRRPLEVAYQKHKAQHSGTCKTELVLEAHKRWQTLADAELGIGAKRKSVEAADKITDELFKRIGRRKMENAW
jgi:hypothetical protein